MIRLSCVLAIVVGVVACGGESRKSSAGEGGGASAGKVADRPGGSDKLEALASALAGITGAPPTPTPTLPDAAAGVTLKNTLTIAAADLAILRKQAGAPALHTVERSPLVELLVASRGGEVHNRLFVGEAATATALRSIDETRYVAVVEERAWLEPFSRNTVSFWDARTKTWVGSLWVTLPLTAAPDKEMAMFRGGTQVGASFTVSEKPEERVVRHRGELAAVVRKAIEARAQQWVSPSGYDGGGMFPFAPATDKVYPVAAPAGAPAIGPADAKVVVQYFGQLGERRPALAIARIVQTYGDRVRVVWRDNPHDFVADQEPAAQAAREVLAAAGPSAYWDFHTLVAAERGNDALTTDALVALAARVGVDEARVRTAIETHAHKAAITADRTALTKAKLRIKPSSGVFVNGWYTDALGFAGHAERIEHALR